MALERTANAGDQVLFDIEVEDKTTQLRVDPTTLTVRLIAPNGADTAYSYGTHAQVSKISTGYFRFKQLVDQAGMWEAIVEVDAGGGTYEGVGYNTFEVTDREP